MKKAFTLAEVLIVIGIVGIIAAMTLPSLLLHIRNYRLKAQFMKTYSDLNQIAQRFYSDYGTSVSIYTQRTRGKDEDLSANWQTFVHKIFPAYFNSLTKDGGISTSQSYLEQVHTVHDMLGRKTTNVCDNSGFKVDLSGRYYIFNDSPYPGDNGPIVCVDINGKQGPNRYGYDYFIFIFTTKGTVIPMGYPDEDNTSDTRWQYNFFRSGAEFCQKNAGYLNQTACAYYAYKNIHPTNDNLDYWNDFLSGRK